MFDFYICQIYNVNGLPVLKVFNVVYNLLLVFDMQGVRRLGAAAVDMCHVALGIVEAYWEYRLKPWDMAAGVLVISSSLIDHISVLHVLVPFLLIIYEWTLLILTDIRNQQDVIYLDAYVFIRETPRNL